MIQKEMSFIVAINPGKTSNQTSGWQYYSSLLYSGWCVVKCVICLVEQCCLDWIATGDSKIS